MLSHCSTLSSISFVPFSCLPRPSPTTSNLQTTTKEKSPTGSPSPACPSLWDLLLSLHAPPPHSSANKCLLKVAGYAAQLEQYQKAIDIYEQVGFAWLSASATHLCLPHSVCTLPGHSHQMLLPPTTCPRCVLPLLTGAVPRAGYPLQKK